MCPSLYVTFSIFPSVISETVHHLIIFFDTYEWNDNISRRFFHFYFSFGFLSCYGRKRAKNSPKWQKILSHSISQQTYIIWLSFVVHKCKMIIFPGSFFIFSKFWCFGLLGGSKCKKWPKMTKLSAALHISGSVHHMTVILGKLV